MKVQYRKGEKRNEKSEKKILEALHSAFYFVQTLMTLKAIETRNKLKKIERKFQYD